MKSICLILPALLLAAAAPVEAGRDTREAPPAFSDIEEEAVFASAVETERRYRHRQARLSRLFDLARDGGDQRRLGELRRLRERNLQRHEVGLRRLERLLETEGKGDLLRSLETGRHGESREAVDPDVGETASRRQLRNELGDGLRTAVDSKGNDPGPAFALRVDARLDRRQSRRSELAATRLRMAERRAGRLSPGAERIARSLRPGLQRHLKRLMSQDQANDEAFCSITPSTAEAEFQLVRQELERDE